MRVQIIMVESTSSKMMMQKQQKSAVADDDASAEEKKEHCYVVNVNDEPKKRDEDEEEQSQSSLGKQENEEATDDNEVVEHAPTITKWEAIFMVINIYVGSPVVTLPAAFSYAGYSAAIIIPLMAVISGLCAFQLVDGMQRAGTSDIYVYAKKASGRFGMYSMVAVYTAAYMIATVKVRNLVCFVFFCIHAQMSYTPP